jgi:hypothetical protein
LRNGCNVIVAPSPLIDGKEGLAEIAIVVNKYTQFLSDSYGIPLENVAIYFNLDYKVFEKNPEKLQAIIDYIHDDPDELNKGKIVLIKVKNYHQLTGIGRENYSQFVSMLTTICHTEDKETSKVIFLLDARTFGLVTTMAGFDGFIEPLDNNSRDFSNPPTEHTQYGQIYSDEEMIFIPHKTEVRRYIERGRIFNSNTETARSYNYKKIEDLPPREWNNLRRKVLLESRHNEIEEIKNAFFEHPRGFAEKIYRSKVKHLVEILPNGF